jgi:pyruvate, water dikinase
MLEKLNIFTRWRKRKPRQSSERLSEVFRIKYEHFKELLDSNAELSKIMSDIEDKLQGRQIFGMSYVRSQSTRGVFHTLRMIRSLDALSAHKYASLFKVLEEINTVIKDCLDRRSESPLTEWVLSYGRITADMVDWVGGKSANLGEVLNRVNLPIPEGFAISTRGYTDFLAGNDLVDDINKIKMELDANDPESVNRISEDIQRLIISAPMVPGLGEAILAAYDEMSSSVRRMSTTGDAPQVSLRSSAIGEDSELSFAGQYLSVLNVPRHKLIQTYKYVIASLFTPRAISYRLNKGIRDEDIAMSVACLEMVDSVASGVTYTHHPFNMLEDNIIITAVWGLGPYAVDGIITPDTYKVGKADDLPLLEATISHKPVQLVSNPEGGLKEIPVPTEKQDMPCLSPEQIKILADYAIKLEKHYGCPQDIEWALDRNGRILVLQTRPLRTEAPSEQRESYAIPRLEGYPLLVENGAVACRGVGAGKAYQVNSEDALVDFPEGGVLVAKHSSPKFVIVMRKAQAIIADSGSVTGHMASLAREFQVPTILDAKVATASIPTGMTVTVDAFSGRVYQGEVPELLKLRVSRESNIKDTPVYQTLKQVAESITPLHLCDPKAASFNPGNCKSLHDIMRFVHELSYAEMFQISDLVSSGEGCAVRLHAPIPLDLYVIDLGGGIKEEAQGARKVAVKDIASAPFEALLRGMLHEDLRHFRPRPVELKGFLSVMSEQMLSNTQTAERFGDRSYAIISDKYLNFSSRVGYHYSILDSYCGQTVNKNYITFSFRGGAADDVRRNRRARAIAMILGELDFTVDVMGDRMDAKFQKYGFSVIQEKLDLLGRLLQFTRQMDMLMHSEATVGAISKAFLEEDYHLEKSLSNS